ncbi:MAG: FAD-binding oxidoreductase [Dehalococcoidales bacterium]|nr:FAD-binding oxidoreductase [Dehalococcoidales bacterium]
MALTKEQYRAFEDIVGAENISADPYVLYSYAWRSGLLAGATKFVPRFEAVVLPGNTFEVQALVRLCNKFGLKFKASSTGWGPYCDPSGPGVVKLDLRRMNRIIEINEKDMYAVVEPYVIGAQLQAELMKRGFTCNMCGAGSNCSAMPIVAHQGIGHFSQSGSYGERNMLALEWVTPDGEIVRLGSLGSTGEWFCGDGPGPSLRGVVRGNVVPLGGLGVYTRAATKIYHWPGPPRMELNGVSPRYTPIRIPDYFAIGFYSFPSLDALDEAQRLIGEMEIAFELMGFNAAMASANIATSNEEDIRLFEEFAGYVQGPCFMIIIAGNSARDFEYKTEALGRIISLTGGKAIPYILDNPEVAGGCLWRWIRSSASIREVFRATGCFGGEVGQTDTFRLMADYIAKTGEEKAALIRRGIVYDDGVSPFTQSFEHGHYGHGELLIRYMPDPGIFRVLTQEFIARADEIAIKEHYGVPGHVFGDRAHDKYGPHCSDYHRWLRKIKGTFDPNGASESSHYISSGK